MRCPKCAGQIPDSATDCPLCGVVIAKYTDTADRAYVRRQTASRSLPVSTKSAPPRGLLKQMALWLYIAVVGSFLIWAFFEPGDPATPVLDLVLDGVLMLAVIGLVLYAVKVSQPALLSAWKVVAPLILIGSVVLLATVILDLKPDPEMSRLGNVLLPMVVIGAFALAGLPLIVVNFRFARGRHLVLDRGVATAGSAPRPGWSAERIAVVWIAALVVLLLLHLTVEMLSE